MMYYDYSYFLYMLPAFLISIYAQMKVQSAYNRYSAMRAQSNITGRQAAQRVLAANGLEEVRIEAAQGVLGDHYDPRTKTLRLSDAVMNTPSIAAVAIAAHECGHALQHQQGYAFLRFRSALVLYANMSNMISFGLIFAGMLFQWMGLITLGICIFSVFVLFQLVTLPVEFNASSRAKAELSRLGIVGSSEEKAVSNMLGAAALTYVAATITALLQLLRLLSLVRRSNR